MFHILYTNVTGQTFVIGPATTPAYAHRVAIECLYWIAGLWGTVSRIEIVDPAGVVIMTAMKP